MNIYDYWKAVLKQDAASIKTYFSPDALIKWHNTNECFTVDEFIRANCEYPGQWDGEVERLEKTGDLIITVTHVYGTDQPASFHVTSFLKVLNGKILSLDEYWGDDGTAPQWRLNKQIGKAIKSKTPLQATGYQTCSAAEQRGI